MGGGKNKFFLEPLRLWLRGSSGRGNINTRPLETSAARLSIFKYFRALICTYFLKLSQLFFETLPTFFGR